MQVMRRLSHVSSARDSVWSEASLGDKNGDEALNPLDALDKRYGELARCFCLFGIISFGDIFTFY